VIFRSAIRVIVILASTAVLAQSGQPGTTPGAPILDRQGLDRQGPARQGAARRKGAGGSKTADPQGLAAMRKQVEDMESTLSRMRGVLKQMHASAGKTKVTDSLTKTNLDLWELMVGQVDKELQQLHLALAERQDLEARRADLYRQADAKAAAQAQAFRAAQAARLAEAAQNASGTPTPEAAGESREQSHPAPTAPAQPSAAPQNQ